MYKEFPVNFHKGLRSGHSPRAFEDGECSIAQDCYFDELGNIYSRKFVNKVTEFTSPVKTIYPYNYIDKLVVVLNDGAMKDEDGTAITTGLAGSSRYSCIEYNDVLYFTNPTESKRYDGTNVQNMGNDEPELAPTCDTISSVVSNCNTAWTPSANVAAEKDEHDYQVNPNDSSDDASCKLTIAAGFGVGVIAYEDFADKNFDSFTHINFWIKSSINIDDGALEIMISDISAGAAPLETLSLPALTTNEWTYVSLTFASPSALIGVISVALSADSDFGAAIIRIDDVIACNGGNPNGEYYYKTTYVDSNGKESNTSPISHAVNPKNEEVIINIIESADSKVDYINLYRLGGSLTAWFYITQVSNVSQDITDNLADGSLVTILDATINDSPPDGLSFIVEHYERMIGAKDTDYLNSVQYSEEYEPEYWGDNLSQQYLIGNKDACTGLLSWGKYIVFSKQNNIYVLEGSNPGTWHRRKSDSSVGNIAPWAFSFYKFPIFLSYDGLSLFDGNKDASISQRLKLFFTDNKSYLPNAIGAIFNDKYFMALPDTDFTLVYDFDLKIFYTYYLKLSEIRYNYLDDSLYAGDDNDNLVLLEQDTNTNDYDTVSFDIKSKAYPLHDIQNRVGNLKNFELSIDTQGEDISFMIYIDNVLKQTRTINTDSMEDIRAGFNASLKGRYAEFRFTYSGAKRIEIEPPLMINPRD